MRTAAGLGILLLALSSAGAADAQGAQPASRPVAIPTFNRDVAPIVHRQCSSCHHPGEAVPFALLTYGDVRKRSRQIAEMVGQRKMPPWMPAHGAGKFAGERRLSDDEIALIRRWADAGAPEGEGPAPAPPALADGWRLGKPDLVVTMPEPFIVPAEGQDLYRNFVVPVGLPEERWVRAVELRPGGRGGVHHAFTYVDASGTVARQRDAAEPGVGYGGMDAGSDVGNPDGHFMSWQPGKQATENPPGLPWRLDAGADLVLQMHLRPAGKPEPVRAEVGLYFTDRPPGARPLLIMLRSVEMVIRAGAKAHPVEATYVLPADVEVVGVLPHLHYLGKRVMAWATLPGGEKRWLLLIEDWNFDWQGDYRYATPVKLPKGTRLSMRYEYDNSEANPRNPNRPPREVRYGLNSSDEMAELWLQVVARDPAEREALRLDYLRTYGIPDGIARARVLLAREPEDPDLRVELAAALLKAGRHATAEAVTHLEAALRRRPTDARVYYHLGHAHAVSGRPAEAAAALEEAIRLDPAHFKARNNLALLLMARGQLDAAEAQLRAAVRTNANDVTARVNLARVLGTQGRWADAVEQLERARALDPDSDAVRSLLAIARGRRDAGGGGGGGK